VAIGAVDEPLEHEAAGIAARMPSTTESAGPAAADPVLRRTGARRAPAQPSAEAPPIVHDVLRSTGRPLAASTRAFFEPRLGHDFRDVRVHDDARAAASAEAVHALAYAVGPDIVFAAGRYAPETNDGRRVLAHELAHVAQQDAGGGPRRLQRQKAPEGDPQSHDVLVTPPECEGRVDITEDLHDLYGDLPKLLAAAPNISAAQGQSLKSLFDMFFSAEAGVNLANFAIVKCSKINLDVMGPGESASAYFDSAHSEIGLSTAKAELINKFRSGKRAEDLTELLQALLHEKRHATLGRALQVQPANLKPGRSEAAAERAEYRAQEILTTAEEFAVGRVGLGSDYEVPVEAQEKIQRQWNMVRGWVTDQEAERLRNVIISKLRERYPAGDGCDSAMTLGVVTSMERGQWFVCDPDTGHAIGRIPAGLNNCTDPGHRVCRINPTATVRPRAADGSAPSTVPPLVYDVLRAPGRPLDAAARAYFEPRLGYDFSQVRVHTDSRAASSAGAVNALAYTVGRDVVFGKGQYAPETAAGRTLLAHELAHVAQQRAARSELAGGLELGRPHDAAERAADAAVERTAPGTAGRTPGAPRSAARVARHNGFARTPPPVPAASGRET